MMRDEQWMDEHNESSLKMIENLSEDVVRNIVTKSTKPVVFKGFVKDWKICQWSVENWCTVFGTKEIPFRCMKRDFISDEPCWERRCELIRTTFKSFIDNLPTCKDWMYFDYKYIHQWFTNDTEFISELSWKQFGYPDKGAADTTFWVGSRGSHTPCHQDTYGVNIVAQLHGKKRWILFPPEAGGLKPTRVPYEESSVYSELNFYCPSELGVFNGLTSGYMVELCAGDALVVPCGWWHYVQNMDELNISVNIWLPHEKDQSMQVSEALIKILVAQICKDLPEETAKLLVNPNEDDLSETPLAVLFLQLETVAKSYLDSRRKARRHKRQKTREDDVAAPVTDEHDIKSLINNEANSIAMVKSITNEDLITLLKENIREYTDEDKASDEDEIDGTSSLCLTKAVIDAFSQSNVIDIVKQNLFARLS